MKQSIQIDRTPKLPSHKEVYSACEGMESYCHKYGAVEFTQSHANQIKDEISKIMTPINVRGYSHAFESECLEYLDGLLKDETIVIDCPECDRDFRTTAKKYIGEKFQCEYCHHPMEAESDYGEDGEIIWYAKTDNAAIKTNNIKG